ncbi:MAG TPA: O-antigen ligase family protein [Bryobacteraceae bacterium]|nr:O-antigen ligase family protein [Bryobacteraceae bacterium]
MSTARPLKAARSQPAPAQPVAPPPQVPRAVSNLRTRGAENDVLRKIGCVLALITVFVRFTGIHEWIATYFGDTYILYLLVPPALLAMLASGGARRTLQWNLARYWLGFAAWLILGIPFSSYKMGSLLRVWGYLRTEFVMLFLIAGLLLTFTDLQRLMRVMFYAALVDVFMARFLQSDELRTRLELFTGTMSNANDFAAQLVLMLPFLLIPLLSRKRNLLLCAFSLLGLGYGLYLILRTGSRGAMLSLVALALVCFWRASAGWKITFSVLLPVAMIGLGLLLPPETVHRLMTLEDTDAPAYDPVSREAAESLDARKFVLQESLWLTITHPVFGVGSGEFMDAEASVAREKGRRGSWHETHNTYTQVSSEAGIPAFIFFAGALVSSFLLLRRLWLRSRNQPSNERNDMLRVAVIALSLSLLGFCVAIFFLSLAYRFYLPAMGGIIISVARVADQEWRQPPAPARSMA